MDGARYPTTPSKPWVTWFAGRISDPVVRLRFLQAVAPEVAYAPAPAVPRLASLLLSPALLLVAAALVLVQNGGGVHPVPVPKFAQAHLPHRKAEPFSEIWQVEKSGSSETYSNGLRVDNRFTVSNHPRSYLAFPADRPNSRGVRRSEPVGIVFHTTESRLAPFEADQNGVLKKLGESLLEYVRRKRAYHFLIDRFGRVFRVVAESDAANHSGNSVWSDDRWLYINLNQSFLGVSVEARTEPGQEQAEMSPAQLRAAAMLTEMLRSRYHIASGNCVTHAQVSVNPSNMQVGYHTDWASSFPFEQLGLSDNYAIPLPALWAFGFEYNPQFVHWAGNRLGLGIQAAENVLSQSAEDASQPVASYRKWLQKHYRQRLEEVRRSNQSGNAPEGEESE